MYSCIYSKEEISKCVSKLAKEITKRISEETIFVPILQGGLFFAADLLREIPFSVFISPVTVNSYYQNKLQGEVLIDNIIENNKEHIENKQLVIVDDICDSGRTFIALKEKFNSAHEILTVSLIKRTSSMFEPDLIGFEFSRKEWLVGYGMDDNGKNRNLSEIYVRN